MGCCNSNGNFRSNCCPQSHAFTENLCGNLLGPLTGATIWSVVGIESITTLEGLFPFSTLLKV